MPFQKKNGETGLLARGMFGTMLKERLPLYDVSRIDDSALLMGLFRDYTFAASAYLLEPCELSRRSNGQFGQGRDHLPANLAVPLLTISDKIQAKPFMEYAQSYTLYNYRRKDRALPVRYENLEPIRQFSGESSESGFMLVHVDMVAHTNFLVSYIIEALDSVAKNDRFSFDGAMGKLISTMQEINARMDKMWRRSNPNDYVKFRTFIMGSKQQENIFPNGIRYEGTVNERIPRRYRGESGANDSIIPTIDNFLELTSKWPENEMTRILQDFRSYRPHDHSRWLKWVETSACELNLEKYAEQTRRSLAFYIMLLNEVRDFRSRHWNFAKEYIVKKTAYPKATGGTPMSSWLPNQLTTVLDLLEVKYAMYENMHGGGNGEVLPRVFLKGIKSEKRRLQRDVKMLANLYGRHERNDGRYDAM